MAIYQGKQLKELTDEELAQAVLDRAQENRRPDPNAPVAKPEMAVRNLTAEERGTKPKMVTRDLTAEEQGLPSEAELNKLRAEDEERIQGKREGFVHLKNTVDGKGEKGEMVPRKMFKTDKEFDEYVQKARSEGNLWDPESDEKSEPSSGPGSRLLGQLAAFLKQASPGAGGGSGASSKGRPDALPARKGADVGRVQSAPSGEGGGSEAPISAGAGGGPDELPERRGGDVGRAVPIGAGGGNDGTRGGAQAAPDLPGKPLSGLQRALASASQAPNAYDVAGEAVGTLKENMSKGVDAITPRPGFMAEVIPGWDNPASGAPPPPTAQQKWDDANKRIAASTGDRFGMLESGVPAGGQPQPPMGAPAPVGPPQGGGSSSASMSLRGGGGAPPAPQIADGPNYDQDIQDESNRLQTAIAASADITSAQEKAKSRAAEEHMASQDAAMKREADRQEASAVSLKKMSDDYAALSEIANNPAKTPDPERYWKSHSKIMFAIGVGLLAQAGKDINGVLANVNKAIDRDVDQQKDEFEAPRKAAKGKMESNQNLYAMMRQQNHDAYESSKMYEALSKERYATHVDKVAADYGSELAQTNAMKISADLRMKAVQAKSDAANHRQGRVIEEYNAEEHARHNRATEEQARVEAARKAVGAGGGKQLPAADSEKLSKLRTASQLLDSSMAEFNKNSSSLPKAMWSKATSEVPRTDANTYNKHRKAFLRTIGLLVDESVIQKHDADAWEELYPLAGDLNGAESLKALKQSVQQKLAQKRQGYKADGFRVGDEPDDHHQTRKLPDGRSVILTD